MQTGQTLGGARFAYFDHGTEPGAAVEIIEVTGAIARLFREVEHAGRTATAATPDAIEWPPRREPAP